MTFLSFGFLILIVLVSGGIAVLADWLGRKLGKKKLTYQTRWFKLRPKKTAQIATFLSGVLVSTFTIAFAYTVSSDVRQWIAEGPRALKRLQQAQGRVEQLNASAESLQNSIWNQRQRLLDLQASDKKQRLELSKLTGQSKKLGEQTKRLRGQLDSFQTRLKQAQTRYAEVNRRFTEIQSQLASTQSKLAGAHKDLTLARKNVLVAQKNLSTTKGDLALSQEQFKEAARQTNEMTQQALEAERRYEELTVQKAELEKQKEIAQDELDGLQRRLVVLQEDYMQTRLAYEKAEEDYRENFKKAGGAVATSRFQPQMFALGDEIARYDLPPGATVDEALQAIRSLVRSAQQIAIERGAEARGPFPAAGIFERTDPATQRIYTPDELEIQLAQSVAGKDESILLIAISTMNAFKTEPVSLDIAVAENPVVYKASEVVAEAKVDGKKDESLVLDQITDFVSNQVKEQARLDRMIPKRGGEASFGSIPMTELYSLVNRVRATGRTVRLQAVAEADTRAGDPLRLDFRVK